MFLVLFFSRVFSQVFVVGFGFGVFLEVSRVVSGAFLRVLRLGLRFEGFVLRYLYKGLVVLGLIIWMAL